MSNPTVNLFVLHGKKQLEHVEQMKATSEEWGFFQVCS